jgi:hypothetical protein
VWEGKGAETHILKSLCAVDFLVQSYRTRTFENLCLVVVVVRRKD